MKIITTICVSTEVYQCFREETQSLGGYTPEEYMSIYLSKHVARIKRKRSKASATLETPSHPDPDTDTPVPSPMLFF